MYQSALRAGIKPGEYLEYSPAEVQDLIEAYNYNIKWEIQLRFTEAEVIVANAWNMFEKPEDRKYIGPWEYFPSLFAEEKEKYEKKKEAEEWESFKEKRMNAIIKFNQSRKGGN